MKQARAEEKTVDCQGFGNLKIQRNLEKAKGLCGPEVPDPRRVPKKKSADWALMTVENGDIESNGGFGLPSMIVLWTS